MSYANGWIVLDEVTLKLLGLSLTVFLHMVTGLDWLLTEVLIFFGVVSFFSSRIFFRDHRKQYPTTALAMASAPVWLDILYQISYVLVYAMFASAFYTVIILPIES